MLVPELRCCNLSLHKDSIFGPMMCIKKFFIVVAILFKYGDVQPGPYIIAGLLNFYHRDAYCTISQEN
jgi:hypothetical protein